MQGYEVRLIGEKPLLVFADGMFPAFRLVLLTRDDQGFVANLREPSDTRRFNPLQAGDVKPKDDDQDCFLVPALDQVVQVMTGACKGRFGRVYSFTIERCQDTGVTDCWVRLSLDPSTGDIRYATLLVSDVSATGDNPRYIRIPKPKATDS